MVAEMFTALGFSSPGNLHFESLSSPGSYFTRDEVTIGYKIVTQIAKNPTELGQNERSAKYHTPRVCNSEQYGDGKAIKRYALTENDTLGET
ncbi:Hypothetical protein NTJ_01367 [Nesidiocoris tenuis]|uniref:Uncharacterized protein n=1 Tax=Nesidiocoris tenuis TaxID=355587 RepID=A0ABN7ACL0_9HEMI|nr:Hypothetical protein NTJ_01367 [Nesidiocoris tenuis]